MDFGFTKLPVLGQAAGSASGGGLFSALNPFSLVTSVFSIFTGGGLFSNLFGGSAKNVGKLAQNLSGFGKNNPVTQQQVSAEIAKTESPSHLKQYAGDIAKEINQGIPVATAISNAQKLYMKGMANATSLHTGQTLEQVLEEWQGLGTNLSNAPPKTNIFATTGGDSGPRINLQASALAAGEGATV
jgi:hypothetical protein